MAGDTKTRLLREAEKYVLQGKISQAIGEYLKIVKSDPDDVLILNTVGDLYLRQGRISEANKLFYQVAENYIRNNFLLKAIAVLKKILASDPTNLELNTKIAALYARQGMNVDARIQYLHVAEMCSKQGKMDECLEAYEKVVELDPMNAAVQLKLADACIAQGNKSRAHFHLAGAARAQAKAGDLQGAIRSYQRALEFDPGDAEILRGLLDAATQLGDVVPVLDQLSHAVSRAPASTELRELLGRAFLAARDVDGALGHFEIVLAADQSRYENFLLASRMLVEANDPDRAAECLEPVLPILIGRREEDKIVEAYHAILQLNPAHVPSLKKLADIFAAVNDQVRYINTLDKLADHWAASDTPAEALPYLARILEANPDSAEHLKMHREIFTAVHPGVPYVPPVAVVAEPSREVLGSLEIPAAAGEGGTAGSALVEIDLLLNYGLKDKALQHLLELEAQDPADKQVRSRLAALYKDMENHREAARQCLLIAALERKAGKEEAAEKLVAEARKLSPETVEEPFDLDAYAEKNGIPMGQGKAHGRSVPAAGMELDLSADLSEIFFRDGANTIELEEIEAEPIDEGGPPEDLSAALPKVPPSVGEQLQEVDFYIRLGFLEEARIKLAEIAREHPGHPELASRYRMLGEEEAESRPDAARAESAAPELDALLEREASQLEVESFAPEENAVSAAAPPEVSPTETVQETPPAPEPSPPGLEEICEEPAVNEMFADLIDEVNALTDQEIAREDFETHFSLGIAYREMNLIDDAIKEFQGAIKSLDLSKSPRETIQCCGMLSTCFLDKGMPRSAIRWCQTALGLPDISSHEKMALQYDMGVAHALAGESERALECFHEIFAIDPTYRDVAQRIDDLKAGHAQHASPDLTQSR